MPDNLFNRSTQQAPVPSPFQAELARTQEEIVSQRATFSTRTESKPLLNLKTPDDFRKGFFNRPDLSDIQAGFAFKEAIESGDQAVVQQFIDAGMFDNLDETATQKAVEMIQNVKDIQNKFTPMGIERMGGIRRILTSGLPGEEKTRSLQTPKGAVEKTIKGPTTDDLVIRERMAAGDSLIEATRALARAKKGEPIEGEREEEKRPLFKTEPTRKQITATEKAKAKGKAAGTPSKPEATQLQAVNGIAMARAAIARLKSKNLSQNDIENEPDPVIRAFLQSLSEGEADPEAVNAAIEAQEARIRFFEKFAPPETKDRTRALRSIFSPSQETLPPHK